MAGAQVSSYEGTVDPKFQPVVARFARWFENGPGGAALVVTWHGQTVIDVCVGYADAISPRRWTPDTTTLVFSATKALAAVVVHRLVDRGDIEYNTPVAAVWPEFATGGKDRITVRQLLAHQAGLYSVRAIARDSIDILDHLAMEDRLALETTDGSNRPGYHAYTYGWLLAGLVRRVTGKGMNALIQEEIARPLGVQGLRLGATEAESDNFAPLVGSAAMRLNLLRGAAMPALGRVGATRAFANALDLPGFHRLFSGPRPPVLQTEMPSANGVVDARSLCALYTALANRGEASSDRYLTAATVRQLSTIQTSERDHVLGAQLDWRMGFYQAPATGKRAPLAFGHCGFGGSAGWADPATGLAFAYVTNDVAALNAPVGGDIRTFRLTNLVLDTVAQTR